MRSSRSTTAAAAAAVCLALASTAAPADARSTPADTFAIKGTVIDRVVATVEDRAILKSDIDIELSRILLQTQRSEIPADQEKAVRKEILQGLVSEALLVIQAEREKITVDEKEVDAQVDRIIEDHRTALGGDDAFNRQLAAEGLSLESLKAIYREKMRTRMLIERLRMQKIGGDVRVSEREVRDYYREHVAELPKRPPTVSLAHILMVPKPSEAVLSKARERAAMIERRLKGGGDFAALAKEYSDCPSAKFGGSLGTIELDDLNNPAFERAASKLSPGETSAPVLTDFGYHLIKVEKVEGDKVTLRHILVRAEATADDVENARKHAEQVRAEIVAGGDFAAAAAKYSDDHATKNAGGVIGEVPTDNLPEEVRGTIMGVPAGGVAPVLKDARGLRIIKVVGWNEERAYTFDEAKDELRRYLMEQKYDDRLESYIEELKKVYSVQIIGEA